MKRKSRAWKDPEIELSIDVCTFSDKSGSNDHEMMEEERSLLLPLVQLALAKLRIYAIYSSLCSSSFCASLRETHVSHKSADEFT